MKNYLTICLSVAISFSAAISATAARQNVQTFLRTDLRTNEFITTSDALSLTRADAGSEVVKVSPTIINAPGDNVNSVWCVRIVDGWIETYGMEDWGDGDEFAFYVPQGTYDFFAYGYTEDGAGTIMLTRENVVVDESFSTITFDTADAVYSTAVEYYGPSGEALTLQNGDSPGNCYRIDNFNCILYYNTLFFFANTAYFNQIHRTVKSNFTSGKFGFASMDFAASKEGMLNMVVPISFTEDEIIVGKSNWQTGQIKVAQTPVNIRKEEIDEAEGADPKDAYTMASFMILQNGNWFLSTGWGVFGEGYDASKVGIWEPEGYTGNLEFVVVPRGAVVNGSDSSIDGLPLRRGENGLQQLGVNYGFENDFVFTETSKNYFNNINPRYSGDLADVVYGNCAPTLLTAKYFDRIRFNFLGRYGEAMNIDSWYNWFASELYGEPTYTVSVTLNGDLIINDQEDYGDYEWDQEGDYSITFTTNNVLVDGEIEGYTQGVLNFDTDTFNEIIPSVTVLSLMDNGVISDHFASTEEAVIGLYAAGLKFNVSEYHGDIYYSVENPEEVTVEYAPYGSDDFVALETEECAEDFFSPGYGAYYEASLSDIEVTWENGWYDLRLTVTTNEGASQSQVVSPAFFVGKSSAVNNISKENNQKVEYFNLQGQRISNPVKGSLVIKKVGNKSLKIIF